MVFAKSSFFQLHLGGMMIHSSLNKFLILICIISFAQLNCAKSTETSQSKPNIIFILADDLGYGDLGCYGQKKIKTPNIDALAAAGMRFTQHYSGSTVCAPSRSVLMTGMHTGHTPIRGNKDAQPEGQYPISSDVITLAEILKKAGYATGAFGKWGLGPPASEGDPLNQGFDRFFGYFCQRFAHNYYPYYLWDNDKKLMLDENKGNLEGIYAPLLIQKEVLAFIEKNKDNPFFAYVPSIIPHAELKAPEKNMRKYRGKFEPEKVYKGCDPGCNGYKLGGYGSQPESHAAFAAMVDLLDEQVGEIVSKIKVLGLDQNTIILFSSDNGPHLEGGADPDYFDSNGILRGYKRDLYEGGIRVPMIVAWPGKVKPGSRTDHISAFWDVLPTLGEITAVKPPEDIDGISFLPTLMGNEQAQHDYLYWEFHERGGRRAIRKDQWKLVYYDVKTGNPNPAELYNLVADPGEEKNLAGVYPEMVEKLTALMAKRSPSEIKEWNF
jgi:arylsulfatase A-like enzyme